VRLPLIARCPDCRAEIEYDVRADRVLPHDCLTAMVERDWEGGPSQRDDERGGDAA